MLLQGCINTLQGCQSGQKSNRLDVFYRHYTRVSTFLIKKGEPRFSFFIFIKQGLKVLGLAPDFF